MLNCRVEAEHHDGLSKPLKPRTRTELSHAHQVQEEVSGKYPLLGEMVKELSAWLGRGLNSVISNIDFVL